MFLDIIGHSATGSGGERASIVQPTLDVASIDAIPFKGVVSHSQTR
jgi:hypothetical protein